jgi:hypothetical protein
LVADSSAIGSVGVLTVGTRGERGPGEVRIKIRGGSESFIAWSEVPLPQGATVLIIEARGPRSLNVMEWASDPLDELGDYRA